MRRGVDFDREPSGELALSLEGGHSARRIVHAGGAETGRAITSRLAELVAESPAIELMDEASATALWTDGGRCVGVVSDRGLVLAAATILSTGGGAALWQRTTNPWGAIGAGAVLAHAAGAELADLELCQFHPTALTLPGSPFDGALITEAVRGEGALLLDRNGRRFTDELAARDQVSTAILDRMDADEAGSVGLDLRPIPLERFPSIERTVREAGLDPAQPVPVAPASHYLIGGVKTDLEGSDQPARSATRSARPAAPAFTAPTGSPRTRSASASSSAAAPPWRPRPSPTRRLRLRRRASGASTPPTEATRAAVWELAGPRRDAAGLERLLADPYPLAAMIAAAALERTESRGVHRRLDHPAPDLGFDGIHLLVRRRRRDQP